MSNMIRQIMALFDEYQSRENAKHTLRAMKENARQGFWNGALPPIGYRIVEAAEQRGHRVKKTLEIDPIQAETVRLIFRLAREGDGSSGPMGVKSIAKHVNAIGIRTRDGGRWRRASPGCDRTTWAEHHSAGPQDVRQAGAQADAHRERRLSPRPPPRTRSARRSGRERSSHHGIEKRTAAHARRRFKRENGGFWRYQFCTEVARPKRFRTPDPQIRRLAVLRFQQSSTFPRRSWSLIFHDFIFTTDSWQSPKFTA